MGHNHHTSIQVTIREVREASETAPQRMEIVRQEGEDEVRGRTCSKISDN